jgi:hypothetical protein
MGEGSYLNRHSQSLNLGGGTSRFSRHRFTALRLLSQEVARKDHSRCPDAASYGVVKEEDFPVHPVYTG